MSLNDAINVEIPAEAPAAPAKPPERKHARSSPSKLKHLEICPSYESDNSKQEIHPITFRGTAMHDAMENDDDSALTTEEIGFVTMCRDFLADELLWAEEVHKEIHVKTHDKDVQGFLDVFLKKGTKGKIRDFKMGFNLVDEPDKNLQALAYVLGVFMKFPDLDEIDFAFLIPRADAVLQHTFTRADLPAIKLRISTIAERVRQLEGVEFNPQNENCLYCTRKALCPTLHSKALTIATGYNDDERLALPTEFHSSEILDPADMARALNMAAVLDKWCDSVRSHALALRMNLGTEIPGYDLIERQGKRTIPDPLKALEIAQSFGLTAEEFTAAATVSYSALATTLKDKTPKNKGKRVQAFEDALRDGMALTRGGSFHVLQKTRKGVKMSEPDALDITTTAAE